MGLNKRIIHWILAGLAASITLYVVIYIVFLEFFVDLWWFRSLGYEYYFWLRLLYRVFFSGGFTLALFSIYFLHFWIAAQFIGSHFNSSDSNSSAKLDKILSKFQLASLKVCISLSLLLAIIVSIPFYIQWESVLLFVFAPNAGIEDPSFGNDVSFYMFSLPIYQLIQQELLAVASVLFVSIAILYWFKLKTSTGDRSQIPLGVKIHLSVLLSFVCLFVAWGFMLVRFNLLYVDKHEPVFYGPGFVEMLYYLPLIWLSIITFLGLCIALGVLIHSHGRIGRKTCLGFIIAFIAVLGLRQVALIPNMLDTLVVQPNPVSAQKSFMSNNIKATLSAYGLDRAKTIDFDISLYPQQDINLASVEKNLLNIPLWDRELLIHVYQQLQAIRPFYKFSTVEEDRYLIDGELQQVNIAAREVNIENLPAEAQNWENTHLRYTHGFGAVVSPAAQMGESFEWYLRGLNMYSSTGFFTGRPDIYYGIEAYPYAIVPNSLRIPSVSATTADENKDFEADTGVPISSFFRKLLFSFYFGDQNIFFSTNINKNSKVLLRRNIIERINTLTPYLALDNHAYLVVAPENFYWIQDAYTLSDGYPVSKPSSAVFRTQLGKEKRSFNYIRNSVKIVVNAYDGSTDFYIVNPEDPIVQAYHRAYPGLFKSMEKIPASLQGHLRYPRDLFQVQMKIYAKYHQTDTELFYQQAETWEFSNVDDKPVKPYYLTTLLEGCSQLQDFILVNPMTPIGRDNLSALAIAGPVDFSECGKAYAESIAIYKFRKDTQVEGPAQLSALIDQDTTISAQFTLWDQLGSSLIRGRMIVLPVGRSVVYVQPIYLVSTQTKIPELVRVIVSMGKQIAMAESLQLAFKQLEEKLK